MSHLGYSLLVVKPALILLAEDDVRRLLVESDAESVKFLLDNLLVRHALSRMGQEQTTRTTIVLCILLSIASQMTLGDEPKMYPGVHFCEQKKRKTQAALDTASVTLLFFLLWHRLHQAPLSTTCAVAGPLHVMLKTPPVATCLILLLLCVLLQITSSLLVLLSDCCCCCFLHLSVTSVV